MDDLPTMPDEDFDALRAAVSSEQERRIRHATIPATVADLARQYIDAGGQVDVLIEAIEGATTPA